MKMVTLSYLRSRRGSVALHDGNGNITWISVGVNFGTSTKLSLELDRNMT